MVYLNQLKKENKMKNFPGHDNQLVALKRIEGQIRGIQKMIESGSYCVDILIQLQAIVGAIGKVEDKILKRHIDSCVVKAFKGGSDAVKHQKIEEVLDILSRFRKN